MDVLLELAGYYAAIVNLEQFGSGRLELAVVSIQSCHVPCARFHQLTFLCNSPQLKGLTYSLRSLHHA